MGARPRGAPRASFEEMVIVTKWVVRPKNYDLLSPIKQRWIDREIELQEIGLQERHIGICTRCGTVNPLKIEDCFMGDEVPGAGTEPHVFS